MLRTHPGRARGGRWLRRVLVGMLLAGVAAIAAAAPASAHVVPSTVIELDVHADDITAELTLPASDLTTASGLGIPAEGNLTADTAGRLTTYLQNHFVVTSTDGSAQWTVQIDDVTATQTEQWGTGAFPAVTATATLTPPDGADLRSFTLDDDVIMHQVVTAETFVILRSDWAAGQLESARTLGTISVDTVTGTIPTLTVNLDQGSAWQGFTGMLTMGVLHIADGTDHQLFLLTLLLPAPLLAIGGRWRGGVTTRRAVRRITAITIAFTIGHSVTLAMGTLGVPVPQQAVEAAIAVSILIAAAHALRPIFPGREPIVAAIFGLVHGMAFSATLSALNLSGSQLALSLLGFNVGIELMQLLVVLLVLPPLLVLSRTPAYRPIRVIAALITAAAAIGWLLDRVGVPTVLGTAADRLGAAFPWIAGALWIAAAVVLVRVVLIRVVLIRFRGRVPIPSTPDPPPDLGTLDSKADEQLSPTDYLTVGNGAITGRHHKPQARPASGASRMAATTGAGPPAGIGGRSR